MHDASMRLHLDLYFVTSVKVCTAIHLKLIKVFIHWSCKTLKNVYWTERWLKQGIWKHIQYCSFPPKLDYMIVLFIYCAMLHVVIFYLIVSVTWSIFHTFLCVLNNSRYDWVLSCAAGLWPCSRRIQIMVIWVISKVAKPRYTTTRHLKQANGKVYFNLK